MNRSHILAFAVTAAVASFAQAAPSQLPASNPFAKPKPPMTMAALPGECRAVLAAP